MKFLYLAVSLIFLVKGGFLFIAGIKLVLERKSFLKTAIKSEGIIISIKKSESVPDGDGGGGTYYCPEIEYTLETGEVRTFFSGISLSKPFIVGSKIKIVYSKDSPNIGEINSVVSLWLHSMMKLCMGGVFISVFFNALWLFIH